MSDESDSSFFAPEEEELVVRKVTSATFMKAKVFIEDEPIDLGDFSDDEPEQADMKAQVDGLGEGTDAQFLTTADQDQALKTLQSYGAFKKRMNEILSIPVVNSKTTDPVKYDLDKMLDPKVQKDAETGDRFSGAHLAPPPRKKRDPAEPDFLKLNRLSAANPKERPSRSFDATAQRHSQYPDPVNVEERFYKYRKNVEEKIKLLEAELMRKEKAECTFEPEILEKRKEHEAPRSAEAFFKDQLLHQKLVNTKIQVLRDKSEAAQSLEATTLYKPKLCEQSMKLLAAKPQDPQPRHEQLFQHHRNRMKQHVRTSDLAPSLDVSDLSMSSQSSVKPFTPEINKASQRIVRDKPVEVYLMEDAARRQRARSTLPTPEPPAKLVTNASQTLLLKRFQEEFNTVWSEVTDTDEVNYTKVSELLKGLKFIDNQTGAGGFHAERELVRSIWPMMKLEDESNISKRNLETFLCAVMNFPQEEKKPVKEVNEEVTEKEAESTPKPGYGRVENSLFLLNPGDTLRIHKHYKAWYDHRATATSKSNLNPTFKSIVEYSYQPALSKGSQRLTEAHLGNITGKGYQHHYDYLADEGRIKAERLQELAKKTEAEVSKECVFQPATDKKSNKMLAQVEVKETEGLASDYFRLLVTEDGQPREKTAVLYDLATFADQRRRKLAKTKAEREMEKNAAECIFEPETAVPLGTIQADLEVRALPARGVDKTVERLIKARKDFEALQALKARGMTNKATREVEKSESTEPMTVLTAVVSGRMQEFRIRAGEHFGTLMSAFAAQHRLGSEELPVIESQLREQYRSLLGKDPE